MRTINFEKIELSKNNKIYLLIAYMHGDGDGDDFEYRELAGIKFTEYENHLDKIEKELNFYKIATDLLESRTTLNYDEIKQTYGEDVAAILQNTPGDLVYYEHKCIIRDIYLIGYDEEGNKYRSYI